MKIGYLVAGFPVLSETFVVNDMRGLEALGHEVVAIALGGADPATANNPNYTIKGKTIRVRGLNPPVWRKVQKLYSRQRLKRKYGENFQSVYNRKPADMPEELWIDRLTWDAAIDQIDGEKLDFLYVHFAMRQLLLGYHASRLLALPLGVTLAAHDIFVNPIKHLFPQLLGQCDFLVTVSGYNKEEILRLAPNLNPDHLHVVANGIDVDAFAPKFHDPGKPFRFAATGRLVEIKGFHVLVEAAGILANRRRDFIVQIVGEGPQREQLERRITEQYIGDVFQLLGRKDASFLQEWLPQQDCSILPCVIAKDGNRDGMPMSLREGMACGLPALSTNILGLHEAVSPGTGLLVDADDAAALANGMEQLIDLSTDEYRAMAQAARNKAEAEFSLMHEVSLIAGWMNDALERRRAAHPEATIVDPEEA